ncbi:uncharacterized protein CDAR_200331 [Caerostris darwini]|uniref:Uncharacterized protein n=1 Tax=Caerostris darwini TaxID=1538125 RepID=A0AAV4RMT0_9ARAC|nr:uncharacterized protein CDAR_200331 [Caerostris darwini]
MAFIIDDYFQFDLNACLDTHSFSSYRSSVEGDGEERRRKGTSRGLSVQQRSGEQRSLDGSTLKSDWSKRESTLLESAEGNPRDILTARIAELQHQLQQAEERYEGLTREAGAARALLEEEREECEGVVFVAKRNVRRLVDQILARQARRRDLGRSIEGVLLQASQERSHEDRQRALEEETLARNIVLLQTKLLIAEGGRCERDLLDRRRRDAEERLAKLDEEHEAALSLARRNLRAKYQRLQDSLTCRDVSEAVVDMTRAQQAAALTQRQRSTVDTQDRYRKAVALSMRLRDAKKRLVEQRGALRREMEVDAALARILAGRSAVARQDVMEAARRIGREDRAPLPDRQLEFEDLIKELETQVFQKMDKKAALTNIVKDQESHKKLLEDEEGMRQLTRNKLHCMAQAAQAVLGITTPSEDSRSGHWEFLEKMSSLLLDPEGESGASMSALHTPEAFWDWCHRGESNKPSELR